MVGEINLYILFWITLHVL